nr:alpha-aminoadipic semialdehyde synthase-like isoform X1 [Ipomoea batatas]
MLGNGIVGILAESTNKWERRVPLTPSHCARLLHGGKGKTGVARIVVQPSTKRIHHDALYEDVGCEVSEDLSECGLILGIKQPKLDMILPDRAYAFFSHTHKAQKENMPLLDKILASKASLFDYELIVGDHGKRLLAFGKFAGRAGMIDFLRGLGQFSHGAQEIFKLLPHTYVDPSKLPELFGTDKDLTPKKPSSKRVFQVYGCVVTCQDMVEHKDPSKSFDKVDYYAHPEHYKPVFHEKIAPYASVIVSCSEYDPFNNTYHHDMEGNGIICSTVDILPTEFAKEASQHFGDILSQFVRSLASVKNIDELPAPLKRACIVHIGNLTPLYEYIPRMRKSDLEYFLINEALDIIEEAGGSFHLMKCQVGQSSKALSYSEVEVGKVLESSVEKDCSANKKYRVLIFKVLVRLQRVFQNAKAIQLDISDRESLHKYISQVDVVVSLLPPSCHSTVASACIELKRNLVTSSYVDDSMSSQVKRCKKHLVLQFLVKWGLDPGIGSYDGNEHYQPSHMHGMEGSSPLFLTALESSRAFKSWAPIPATYRFQGEVVEVEETISILEHGKKTTYAEFLHELLRIDSKKLSAPSVGEKDIIDQVYGTGTLFLGFHESIEIPVSCKSAFDVTCSRMEERLTYTEGEKDMVLLHHEVVVDFPDGQTETHQATLLEFGRTNDGRTTTAMAITVGLPAAIGALLLLSQKIKASGVLRPTDAEVYVPGIRFKVGREDRVAEKP